MENFWEKLFHQHQTCPSCPPPAEVARFFTEVLGTLFADYSQHRFEKLEDFENYVLELKVSLHRILRHNRNTSTAENIALAERFFQALPEVHRKLNQDVDAMFQGDPAAKSRQEVIRTYPGFYAIAAYRIAHELHKLSIAEIPRVITEHAHSKTGVDIHPAARIGEHFCIDHGTGIVIGETAVIGNHVKLYQGVTLGALSVSKADAERKRHPTIEDNVIVYAGATILGGDTVIGSNSVIGGNVWLTRSVPAGSKIYYQARMYDGSDEPDTVIFRTH